MKRYIQLGTTGNKATLYDNLGSLVTCSFHGYATKYEHVGWAEQNPEDWWKAVCATTQELLQISSASRDEIACVVISGQVMGCVPVDQKEHPIRDAIIWADQRSVEQAKWMADQISPEEVHRITGHCLSPSYSASKMLWVRDHQPDIYNDVFKFLHAKDYFVAHLTGNFVTDRSDVGGMNLYNLDQAEWSERILHAGLQC